MTEGAMLKRAVLENPDDDNPRLAYADWLMENGREGYGEYLKLCVESDDRPCPRIGRVPMVLCDRNSDCPVCSKRLRLNSLYDAAEKPIRTELAGYGCRFVKKGPFHRGMVRRLEMPCADFVRHAEALFRRHPVTEVLLSDLGDYVRAAADPMTFVSDLIRSPVPLYPLLKSDEWASNGYGGNPYWRRWKNKRRAERAWSAACVAHGRELAGLSKRAYEVAV